MRYTKWWIAFVAGLLVLAPFCRQRIRANQSERIAFRTPEKLMQEILNIPDDIPQDLIDRPVAWW